MKRGEEREEIKKRRGGEGKKKTSALAPLLISTCSSAWVDVWPWLWRCKSFVLWIDMCLLKYVYIYICIYACVCMLVLTIHARPRQDYGCVV